ncbi:MAG: T9SS type A sorting domain-containing protein [Bacteroidota bacterium]
MSGNFWVTLLDVNNDGADDMIWVPSLDSLWIMYGGAAGLSGSVDRIFRNHDPERWPTGFGSLHHRIGDYNGDGYNDFIINYSVEGFPAMVVVGGDADGLTNEPLSVCVAAGRYGGRMIVDLGDINGDGADEHIISDPISPIPDLQLQPGFAAVIRGYPGLNLGVDDSLDSDGIVPEPFSVEVYPAPSSGDVNINLRTHEPGEYALAIYSLDGKLLYERLYELTQRENVLMLQQQDLSGVASPAVLLIRIAHNGQTVQRKLVRK